MKKYKIIYILNGLLLITCLLEAQNTEPNAVFLNKGLMNVQSSTTDNTCIYIVGDMVATGESKIYVQKASVKLTGDLINNVSPNYHVFAGNEQETDFSTKTNGQFEFAGTKQQKIRGTASKENSFIYFPRYTVLNNKNSSAWKDSKVTLVPEMGATMTNIIHRSGRLILDSKPDVGYASIHAHLLLKGNQQGTMFYDEANPNNPWGGVQVNLSLGNNQGKRLIGFASPFQETYADYFLFNFLSEPSPKGLFGDNGLLITNPLAVIAKGKGYLVGMGLVDDPSYYTFMLDPEWNKAKYNDRATTMFEFGGFPYSNKTSIQMKTTEARYGGEILNNADIQVNLKKGFNYLGNSFTAPLDMTSFVDTEGYNNDWKATLGGTSADVRNSFYILSNGTGEYKGDNRFEFNATYLLGQKVGGTYKLGNDTRTQLLIPPMQMFIVYSNTDNVSLTIPAGKRTHGNAIFLRSMENYVTDELLIETIDTQTDGFDRLCIVFRNNATQESNDPYDAVKVFNSSGGVNQIYTRSSDNKNMTTNVIGSQTKKLTMYFEPSLTAQEVELTAHRINSLQSIYDIILEDKQTGTQTNLMQNRSYRFVSSPADKSDRFIFHFYSNPTGIEDINNSDKLSAYYESNTIHVKGLNKGDLNNYINIYNSQGQLLHNERVTEGFSGKINKSLTTGIYIIKIENNPQVIKFFAK